jgi:hypothetical protein
VFFLKSTTPTTLRNAQVIVLHFINGWNLRSERPSPWFMAKTIWIPSSAFSHFANGLSMCFVFPPDPTIPNQPKVIMAIQLNVLSQAQASTTPFGSLLFLRLDK